MELVRKKNAATYIVWPVVDTANGTALVTGLTAGASSSCCLLTYWDDASAAESATTCINNITEATIEGGTGMGQYVLKLCPSETNHDYLLVHHRPSSGRTQTILIRTYYDPTGSAVQAIYTGLCTVMTICSSNQSAISALMNQVCAMSTTLTATLYAKLTAIESAICAVQNEISALSTTLTATIYATLTAMQSTLSSITNQISALSTTLTATIYAKLTAIESAISAMQKTMTAADSSILCWISAARNDITAGISSLQDDISSIRTDITGTLSLIRSDISSCRTDLSAAISSTIGQCSAIYDSMIALSTVVTLASDTDSFKIDGGITQASAYETMLIAIQDAGDAHWEVRRVASYGADKEVTVSPDFSFTPAVNDKVKIFLTGVGIDAAGGACNWLDSASCHTQCMINTISAMLTNISADIATLDTAISAVQNSVSNVSTDLSELYGSVVVLTTVVTLASDADSFKIDAGLGTASAYESMLIAVEDAGDNHWEVRRVAAYAADKEVTVSPDFSFTPAVNDKVKIMLTGVAIDPAAGTCNWLDSAACHTQCMINTLSAMLTNISADICGARNDLSAAVSTAIGLISAIQSCVSYIRTLMTAATSETTSIWSMLNNLSADISSMRNDITAEQNDLCAALTIINSAVCAVQQKFTAATCNVETWISSIRTGITAALSVFFANVSADICASRNAITAQLNDLSSALTIINTACCALQAQSSAICASVYNARVDITAELDVINTALSYAQAQNSGICATLDVYAGVSTDDLTLLVNQNSGICATLDSFQSATTVGLDNLYAMHTSISTMLTNLSGMLTNVSGMLTNISADICGARNDITAGLSAGVGVLNTAISGIQTDLSNISTDISNLRISASTNASQIVNCVLCALNTTGPATVTTNSITDYIRTLKWGLANKMIISDATGDAKWYKDDGTTLAGWGTAGIITAWVTDDSDITTRKQLK